MLWRLSSILTTITTKNIYEGGRFINESDINNNRKVCVIGERTQGKNYLKKDENPIGKFIRINRIYLKLMGMT